jgi:hypothetical protein
MEETQKILEEIQKKTYQGILWAIFWSAGLVALLTAGILLNTPGISWACTADIPCWRVLPRTLQTDEDKERGLA